MRNKTIVEVEIACDQTTEFLFPDAGGVEDFQDSPVPVSQRGGRIHLLENLPGLLLGEHVSRQTLGLPGILKSSRRIVMDQPLTLEEPEEAL